IIAQDLGILARDGHTEATIELITRAGFLPVGVLCEVLQGNGKVARGENLTKFAKKFNLKIVTILDLTEYVKSTPSVVKKSSSYLPTQYGTFRIAIYQSMLDNTEHVALMMGDVGKEPIVTRIHSQCLTGDTLFSLKCDCGEQLQKSMQIIQKEGRGILLYLNQEGRGIGLANKIKAYALQEKGLDTVSANEQLGFSKDARSYNVAAQILQDLGVKNINLLTNNPAKEKQLVLYGIHIQKTIPLEIKPNGVNRRYLKTKKQKLGHRLSLV
ncbi:MAG: GTP cyclohydrolase II, partial [Candidatus Levybacteria bacterium]|nr:GTP cyclohydrolase II [Candidatus Levybacteria bacterium]